MINKYRLYKYGNNVLSYFFLLLLVFFAAFPIFLIIINSFKDALDIWAYPPKIFSKLTVQNFTRLASENPRFFSSVRNSIIITAGALVITLVFSFAAAFAFSRYKSRAMQIPALILIAMRMFPPIVITIPLYPFLRSLGLVDNHFTLMVINAAFSLSLATMMMKTFVDDVPVELEEAAMIEGCSKLRAFVTITLPLTAPGITAVAIFVAIGIWNEYTFAYIFSTTKAITAPVVITTVSSDVMGVNWGALFSACVIQLLPMLIMVTIIHKYLIRGVQSGAIK
ncbi:carbohydrate ABC transporter permease [Breznakiella homolactica]|uniref:Carbohydrate ABC transporter permease n=1 Tax=Breznakiella homolactica TaxID=2798577 RepID=A0A7T7XP49_9SPIR|nr:carbohydrate ABC transporter permease [Breznakiella homolactica]QQO09944.1 carbohydrate ABC transporter permease [Breznakiella homolactica]